MGIEFGVESGAPEREMSAEIGMLMDAQEGTTAAVVASTEEQAFPEAKQHARTVFEEQAFEEAKQRARKILEDGSSTGRLHQLLQQDALETPAAQPAVEKPVLEIAASPEVDASDGRDFSRQLISASPKATTHPQVVVAEVEPPSEPLPGVCEKPPCPKEAPP